MAKSYIPNVKCVSITYSEDDPLLGTAICIQDSKTYDIYKMLVGDEARKLWKVITENEQTAKEET